MTFSLEQAVARCQTIMAHAWMVRTFVKHSPEVEEFPELMDIVRTVFDLSRALETRVADPAGYLHMLKKKIGKLRKAADKFRQEAPLASTHTNFQQAVVSIDACVAQLEEILAAAPTALPQPEHPCEREASAAQEDQME
jgi:hypothetical protein